MTSNENIKSFYDDYVKDQRETGINDRIYGLYERMIENGLRADSKVLELGCGIGMLSHLLAQVIKTGALEGIDISSESIHFAKTLVNKSNFKFATQDITEFTCDLDSIQFITLFDVLEHIPLDKHESLFKRISDAMDDNTIFLINLPNPDFIALDIAQEADSLQIVDQAVPLGPLVVQFENAGLELMTYEKYGIWNLSEYQWFVLRKARPFHPVAIEPFLTLAQKIERKWKRFKIARINKKIR